VVAIGVPPVERVYKRTSLPIISPCVTAISTLVAEEEQIALAVAEGVLGIVETTVAVAGRRSLSQPLALSKEAT